MSTDLYNLIKWGLVGYTLYKQFGPQTVKLPVAPGSGLTFQQKQAAQMFIGRARAAKFLDPEIAVLMAGAVGQKVLGYTVGLDGLLDMELPDQRGAEALRAAVGAHRTKPLSTFRLDVAHVDYAKGARLLFGKAASSAALGNVSLGLWNEA